MTTLEARKAILADLEAGGYIKEIEPLKHDVVNSSRLHHAPNPWALTPLVVFLLSYLVVSIIASVLIAFLI